MILSVFCLTNIYPINASTSEKVAILPFLDKSEFKGPWNLGKDIEKYITTYMHDRVDVVPFDTVDKILRSKGWISSDVQNESVLAEAGKLLGSRYIITGRITNFYALKKMAGSG